MCLFVSLCPAVCLTRRIIPIIFLSSSEREIDLETNLGDAHDRHGTSHERDHNLPSAP